MDPVSHVELVGLLMTIGVSKLLVSSQDRTWWNCPTSDPGTV